MVPVALRAWLPLPADVVEAGLAACVTASAVFVPATWIVDENRHTDLEPGARVVVEFASVDGVIVRVAGIVGWRQRSGDDGVGIFVGASVDAASDAVLTRLARRPGAGSRVQPPGRSRPPSTPPVAAAAAVAVVDDELVSGFTRARRSLLADRASLDDALPETAPLPPAPPPSSPPAPLPLSARALELERALGAGIGFDDTVAAIDDDVEHREAGEHTTSGAVERPFGSLLLDAGVGGFPDAIDIDERAFEPSSTDVDLLGEVSADDIVGFESPPPTDALAQLTRADLDDADSTGDGDDHGDDHGDDLADIDDLSALPSGEAELVEDDDDDDDDADDEEEEDWGDRDDVDHGLKTTVMSAWSPPPTPLPPPVDVALDDDDDDDAQPVLVGLCWVEGRRGAQGHERVAWPWSGTKRYAGLADADLTGDDDAEVFGAATSAPPPPPPPSLGVYAAPSLAPPDPFAAQITDPRLNVEGLVARHVRAGLDDVFARDDVDVDHLHADPDATSDELRLPLRPTAHLDVMTQQPLSERSSDEDAPR